MYCNLNHVIVGYGDFYVFISKVNTDLSLFRSGAVCLHSCYSLIICVRLFQQGSCIDINAVNCQPGIRVCVPFKQKQPISVMTITSICLTRGT